MARSRKRRSSRKGKEPAGLKRYRLSRKKKHSINPPKRRKRRATSRRKKSLGYSRKTRKAMAGYGSNPRRKHRRHRRNPSVSSSIKGLIPSSGFVMDAAFVTGGFFLTRIATGYAMPFLGSYADQPIVRIAAKGAVSVGLGFLGGKFLGAKNGQLLMLGGLVEVLSDAVRTYVAPYVPALAGEEVGSYPAISSYPMGDAYSNPYSVGVEEFDEV